MDNPVCRALVCNVWDFAVCLIRNGYPRPDEDELLNYDFNTSITRYYISLGLPINYLSETTARIVPTLLERLKEPTMLEKTYKYEQINGYELTENLLEYALETRPDLHDTIRKIVLAHSYLSLFERFEVKFEEIVDLERTFGCSNFGEMKKWMRIWNVDEKVFYPVMFHRNDCYRTHMSEEFLQYCLGNWETMSHGNRAMIIDRVPKSDAALSLRELNGWYNVQGNVHIYEMYGKVFPELLELLGQRKNCLFLEKKVRVLIARICEEQR